MGEKKGTFPNEIVLFEIIERAVADFEHEKIILLPSLLWLSPSLFLLLIDEG